MSFLRRGNIRVLHAPTASLSLHRIDGFPVKVRLVDVSCYEEHRINLLNNVVNVYFTNGSSVAVREDFDAITTDIEAKAVPNVI